MPRFKKYCFKSILEKSQKLNQYVAPVGATGHYESVTNLNQTPAHLTESMKDNKTVNFKKLKYKLT